MQLDNALYAGVQIPPWLAARRHYRPRPCIDPLSDKI